MLVAKITKAQFINLFKTSSRSGQFSEEALGAIYDYLDDMQGDNPPDWQAALAGDIESLGLMFQEVKTIVYYDEEHYGDDYLVIATLSNDHYLLM